MLGSLKLRLALASAALIAVSVAGTVLIAIHEVEQRAEDAIIDTNLGAAEFAAVLSASVIVRQRALSATAGLWPRNQVASPAAIQAFLERQQALGTLFNRLRIVARADLTTPERLSEHVSPPLHGLAEFGEREVAMVMPLPSSLAQPLLLAGLLDLQSDNFLSDMPQSALLDDPRLTTVVANQQGYVLAHADNHRLLSLVDEDPDLRRIVAKWRSMGSPLEPAPFAGRFGGQIAAMAAVPGTDWLVFRVAEGDALFGAASRAIQRTVALGACVAATGALVIFGLTAWLLTPMGQLRRRALLALDSAQPAALGWPEAGGEVGELSRVLRHVSEQLASSQSEIEQTLKQMQAVLSHAPVGIAFIGEGRIQLASSQLESMLGYAKGELDREWTVMLSDGVSHDELRHQVMATFLENRIYEAEMPLRRRDGSVLWARVQGAAVQGTQNRTIWIISDATAARRQREDLTWSATRDPLTELVNRREFERRLAELVSDRRRHGSDCALFIDLDHFKQVNDGAGHAAGDMILKSVAKALQGQVRSEDTVGRLGGDEFAVLLRDCPAERALEIAEQMRIHVENDGVCPGQPALRVTASIGIVEIDDDHHSLADVLQAADQACYDAKHAGRNAVRMARRSSPAGGE